MATKKEEKELTDQEKLILTLMIMIDPTILIAELVEAIKPKK